MKRTMLDETTLREFKRLAALVEGQSGIRLNVDKVVNERDEQTLRVWEKTLQARNEMKRM
jgi:hypothetical protein